jgi:hypothetical protein
MGGINMKGLFCVLSCNWFFMVIVSGAVWVKTGNVNNTMWYMLFFLLSLGFAGVINEKKQ